MQIRFTMGRSNSGNLSLLGSIGAMVAWTGIPASFSSRMAFSLAGIGGAEGVKCFLIVSLSVSNVMLIRTFSPSF
ncbi:Uncharacterised protein [Mycobacteroides abscessus subsp. abscessus]|nr:Uncharacterised protein [Mycobacteroides abscessus subsp. abscessus]